MNHREAKREKQRLQSNREELVERMERILPEDGSFEAFDGFFLARSSKPMESVNSLYQPAFSLNIRGLCGRKIIGVQGRRRCCTKEVEEETFPIKVQVRPLDIRLVD